MSTDRQPDTLADRIQALELLTPVPRTQAILGLREELTSTAYLDLLLTYQQDFLEGERRMKAVQAMAELRPSLQQRDLALSADFEEALEWIRTLQPRDRRFRSAETA